MTIALSSIFVAVPSCGGDVIKMLSSKPEPPQQARSGPAQEREAAGKVIRSLSMPPHPWLATAPDNAACSTMMHWYFASVARA